MQTQILVPNGTIARVRVQIKRGNYNDPTLGLTGGWATRNPKTGVIYLNCVATLLEGDHKQRKAFFRVGLYSPKTQKYAEQGMRLLRAILESSHGFFPADQSEQAVKIRNECNLSDFDGIEFVARIEVEEENPPYPAKNTINFAITPDDSRYLGNSQTSNAQKS